MPTSDFGGTGVPSGSTERTTEIVFASRSTFSHFNPRTSLEEEVVTRCPRCGGLRLVSARQARRRPVCRECSHGRVVPLSAFHSYWIERFTREEIEAMARAIRS